MNDKGKNQGEGDRDADRKYRTDVRQFVDEGRVDAAADAARSAIDGPEGKSLRAAEQAGRARMAEEDPSSTDSPLPRFWTDEQQSAWDRVKEALYRDWLQTKADFKAGGLDLDQSAADTVKQAAGKQALPGASANGLGWERARHAIRLGHGAATYWPDDTKWNDDLETRVRAEWEALGTGLGWEAAGPLVKHGWKIGRKDVGTGVEKRNSY
jgi:hypothetical protein